VQERNRSFSGRQGSSSLFSILLKQRLVACELEATTAQLPQKRRTSLEESGLALLKNSLLTAAPSRRRTMLKKKQPKKPKLRTTMLSNSSDLASAD
jgi:hypothetical protein